MADGMTPEQMQALYGQMDPSIQRQVLQFQRMNPRQQQAAIARMQQVGSPDQWVQMAQQLSQATQAKPKSRPASRGNLTSAAASQRMAGKPRVAESDVPKAPAPQRSTTIVEGRKNYQPSRAEEQAEVKRLMAAAQNPMLRTGQNGYAFRPSELPPNVRAEVERQAQEAARQQSGETRKPSAVQPNPAPPSQPPTRKPDPRPRPIPPGPVEPPMVPPGPVRRVEKDSRMRTASAAPLEASVSLDSAEMSRLAPQLAGYFPGPLGAAAQALSAAMLGTTGVSTPAGEEQGPDAAPEPAAGGANPPTKSPLDTGDAEDGAAEPDKEAAAADGGGQADQQETPYGPGYWQRVMGIVPGMASGQVPGSPSDGLPAGGIPGASGDNPPPTFYPGNAPYPAAPSEAGGGGAPPTFYPGNAPYPAAPSEDGGGGASGGSRWETGGAAYDNLFPGQVPPSGSAPPTFYPGNAPYPAAPSEDGGGGASGGGGMPSFPPPAAPPIQPGQFAFPTSGFVPGQPSPFGGQGQVSGLGPPMGGGGGGDAFNQVPTPDQWMSPEQEQGASEFLQGTFDQYQGAMDAANAANESRYNQGLDLLSGMNTQQNQMLGGLGNLYGDRTNLYAQGADAVMNRYNDPFSFWASTSANVGRGYDALHGDVMGRTGLMGATEAENINQRFGQQAAQAEQDLISRGLGNTTIRPAVQRGIAYDQSRAQTGLAEDVANQLNQLDMGTRMPMLNWAGNASQFGAGLLGNTAQAAERAIGNIANLQGEGLQFGERANQAQQGIGQQTLSWIGNRTDQAPDYNTMAGLASQIAAGGVGWGNIPSLPAPTTSRPPQSPNLPYMPPQQQQQRPSNLTPTTRPTARPQAPVTRQPWATIL